MDRLTVVLASFLASIPVFAAPGQPSSYGDALRAAQSRLEETRGGRADSEALILASSAAKGIFGRSFRVGDSWKVASWIASPGKGGVFLYEVIRVGNGGSGDIEIRVTQQEELGLKFVDARVESMSLTLDHLHRVVRKAYFLQGQDAPVVVPSDGLRVSVSEWERFPLEAFETEAARARPAMEIEQLPEPLARIARQVGLSIEGARSVRLERSDFLGRKIEAVWQQGDPWPAVLRTSDGASILLGVVR